MESRERCVTQAVFPSVGVGPRSHKCQQRCYCGSLAGDCSQVSFPPVGLSGQTKVISATPSCLDFQLVLTQLPSAALPLKSPSERGPRLASPHPLLSQLGRKWGASCSV